MAKKSTKATKSTKPKSIVKPSEEPERYKILRGLRGRVETVRCKSVFDSVFKPSEHSEKEERDLIVCNVNVADNKNDNWDKHRKKLKSARVQSIVTFQIDVKTDPSLDIEVKNLCNSKNVKCENILPPMSLEEFMKAIPRTTVFQSGIPMQIPTQQMAMPSSAGEMVNPPTPSTPVSPVIPKPPPKIGTGTLSKSQLGESLKFRTQYIQYDTEEKCQKAKTNDVNTIWVEYASNKGVKTQKCIPIDKNGIPTEISEKELCEKLASMKNPLLDPFIIEWKTTKTSKTIKTKPPMLYTYEKQDEFDKKYSLIRSGTENREERDKKLKALIEEFKPFENPMIDKTIESEISSCIINKKEPEKPKESIPPPPPPKPPSPPSGLPPPPPLSGSVQSQPPATLKPPPPPPKKEEK